MRILLSHDVFRNYQAQCFTVAQDLQLKRQAYGFATIPDSTFTTTLLIISNNRPEGLTPEGVCLINGRIYLPLSDQKMG